MAKNKRVPKFKQVRETLRRPNGQRMSYDEAKEIVKIAKGKTTLLQAREKYFNTHPLPPQKKRLRDNAGHFLNRFETQEIREAARQMKKPLEEARNIFFEKKLFVEVEEFELAHTIESQLLGYLERNPDLIIRVKKAGSTKFSIGKGAEGLELFLEELRLLNEIILKHQNKSKPKNKRNNKIDSPNLPFLQPVIKRRAGSITPIEISFDYNKSETAATLEDREGLENLEF